MMSPKKDAPGEPRETPSEPGAKDEEGLPEPDALALLDASVAIPVNAEVAADVLSAAEAPAETTSSDETPP